MPSFISQLALPTSLHSPFLPVSTSVVQPSSPDAEPAHSAAAPSTSPAAMVFNRYCMRSPPAFVDGSDDSKTPPDANAILMLQLRSAFLERHTSSRPPCTTAMQPDSMRAPKRVYLGRKKFR